MRCNFGAHLLGIDRVTAVVHDIVVDAVFNIWRRVRLAEQSQVIRLVLGKQQRDIMLAMKQVVAQFRVADENCAMPSLTFSGSQNGLGGFRPPRPDIAEPECRQNVDGRRLRSAIA